MNRVPCLVQGATFQGGNVACVNLCRSVPAPSPDIEQGWGETPEMVRDSIWKHCIRWRTERPPELGCHRLDCLFLRGKLIRIESWMGGRQGGVLTGKAGPAPQRQPGCGSGTAGENKSWD